MAHIFWACITSCLRKAPVEIETVRLDGKPGKWFLATISVSGTDIVVTPATVHTPSCSIKSSRRITQNEFCTVFPHFFTWLRRIEQRKKIRNYGQNTSYIFALIAHFLVVCLVAKLKSSSVPCRTILQRLIDWIIAEILELSEITDATQTNNLCKEAQIASVLSNTSIPAPCGNGAVYGKFLQYETKEKTINFWIGLPDEANDPNVYLWFFSKPDNGTQKKLKELSFESVPQSDLCFKLRPFKDGDKFPGWLKALLAYMAGKFADAPVDDLVNHLWEAIKKLLEIS